MNTYKELDGLTLDAAVSGLRRQLDSIGQPGEVDLFGAARTDEDCVRAIRELGRVAQKFAEKLADDSIISEMPNGTH